MLFLGTQVEKIPMAVLVAITIVVSIGTFKAKINHQRAKIILEEAQQFSSDRQISRIELTHEL